jgi:hypothetical protein
MEMVDRDVTIESIERVLTEKEAVLAKEQAMLESLRALVSRMGYTLVPTGETRRQRGRSRQPGSSVSPAVTSGARGGRQRGRSPKVASPDVQDRRQPEN